MSQPSSERVDAAVSYSRADQAVVEPILTGLRGRGLAVWFDKDIPGGALWEEIIARKYRASGALLFFLSKSSLASQRCSEEVSTARTLGKPIIPVLIEPLRLPDDLPDRFVLTLQARNTVDAFDRPHEEAESAILAALQGFGIAPGEPLPQTAAPAAAATRPAASRPAAQAPVLPSRSSPVKWIAFGGLALAVLLVGAGYVMFGMKGGKPSDGATVAATSPAAVATRPAVAADPVNPPAPAPEPSAPAPSPAPGPTPAPSPAPTAPPPVRPASVPSETSAAKVSPLKPSYQVGYPIMVSIEGMPGGERDYVALAEAGAPPAAYVYFEYTQGARAKDLKLRPVMKPGDYELRLFFQSDADAGQADRIRAATPLTITPAGEVTLTPAQAAYAEAQPLTVAFAGMPGNDKDWIAVAASGSPEADYISYVYTQGRTTGSVELKSLMKPGPYEIRAFFDDGSGDRTVRGRTAIEIVPAAVPRMELDAETYAPGDTITVTYSDMPTNERDWFSVAAADSKPDQYLSYGYTGGSAEGAVELKAPDEPGAYEIRAYFDDSSGDKTIRATVLFDVSDEQATPEEAPAAGKVDPGAAE
jgi:hypothetical protein